MTKEEAIIAYNNKLGGIVPNIGSALIDFCSLSDVIDNTREFSFKMSLFPSDTYEQLLDFTDTTYLSSLIDLEENLLNIMKQIVFYPKFNTTFETKIHVPILNLDLISADDDIKSVFQIPIAVTYYIVFNNTINTIKRYYNSNLYFDHTAYMLIPTCIVDEYDFEDMFYQEQDSTTPYTDSSIFDYGIDFTTTNNFRFVVDDADILALTKNIAFMEISLTTELKKMDRKFSSGSSGGEIDLYFMIKSGANVFLKKGKASKLTYRKVFYNLDFLNIKNRIVKYSD